MPNATFASKLGSLGIEDGFEVAVAFNEAGGGSLEVGFSEFGFEEEIVEAEIDLSAIG